MKRSTFLRSVLAACAIAAVGSAQAQSNADWPNRPIRLVVPAGPGGGNDIWARMFGEELRKILGQTVIVENKPGANGAIATDLVAKSKPDGYTVLFSNASATSMLQALHPKLPYDLLRDLVPVAQIGLGGVFIAVTPSFPATNMKEFAALVKAQPGKYTYAHFGIGSSGYLIMEALKKREGLDIADVPYKTIAQIVTDLQSDHVKVGIVDTTSSLPFIRSGKIRVLAATGSRRPPSTPTVQTLAQQGYPFDIDGWYGVFVPAGTPPEIVRKLNAAILSAHARPEIVELFRQSNTTDEPPLKTPEQFAQTVRDDIRTWSDIVRTHNIRVE